MFDFGNANDGQKKAIQATEGPVLIIAGPGTGKTYTLVQRALFLMHKGIRPEQILIATFTRKAANELVTRLADLAEKKLPDLKLNINNMYIGTIHSICLRIIEENAKESYRVLNDFDQKNLIADNIAFFREVENITELFPKVKPTPETDGKSAEPTELTEIEELKKLAKPAQAVWDSAGEIQDCINILTEEMITPQELKEKVTELKENYKQIGAMGEVLERYYNLLNNEDNSFLDYAAIQTRAFDILKNSKKTLAAMQEKIKYIMVDEYQDTNYVQEQIIFLLGSKSKNICVVGDDDQGLYRFRGATIRNILQFEKKVKEELRAGKFTKVHLDVNYRSTGDIIKFCKKWMNKPVGFSWGEDSEFRLVKDIKPPDDVKQPPVPTVIKLSVPVCEQSVDERKKQWYEKVYRFIKNLRDDGKITDYNQVAVLFRSARHTEAKALAAHLERGGINEEESIAVNSPRGGFFFLRDEIRLIYGCLMKLFPEYMQKFYDDKFEYMNKEQYSYMYYAGCIEYALKTLEKEEHEPGLTPKD